MDLPRWSTAPHVQWADLSDVSERPILAIVDVPGGPMDQLAADADVATFLNDRFTAYFFVPDAAPGLLDAPGVLVVDRAGCSLAGPARPATAAELIALANAAVTNDRPAPRNSVTRWGVELPDDHPLARGCSGP